jgi:hypothetical protein
MEIRERKKDIPLKRKDAHMANSEYQKRQDGSGTVFDVTPATTSKSKLAIVMGVIFGLFGLIGISSSPIFGILCFCGCGFIIWAGSKDWRPKAQKSKATFRVTPSAIETNGQTFKKEDIHRLIVKNGLTDLVEVQSMKTSLAGSNAARVGAAAGYDRMKKMSKIAHSLDLEAGGKAYTLAGGMDETTAFGLMKDVRNVIGAETWT